MEHIVKSSEDVGEVVFGQPEKKAGATGPDGSVLNRRKEDEWLEDTEPYQGARPRTIEVDRPVDDVLGATLSGTEQDCNFRDTSVPKLPPKQQIQQEEEVQTPPRREPRRNEGHQPRGPRAMTDGTVLAPGGLAEQRTDTAGRNRQTDEWSPVAALENTVSRMQRDLEDLQTENRFLRTPRAPVPVPLVRQAALTTTKVPWFNGSTSWEQYRQVFDAIVLSNGWGDATAALQLLSHLQDDALSVALLIPMPLRASRKALTDALSSHYGSPGRLANYRREFDKTVRKPGEDPSNFAITLETLAVKAFGDMGRTARLRLIRDRFIAGHGSCDLRRYLDCVPPDTPLRDIVDRCRVWESHADPEVRRVSKPMPEPAYPTYVVEQSEYETEPVRVVTVNKPNSSVDQSEELLNKILAVLTPIVSPPARAPELSPMDKLVQLLLSETAKRKPVPPTPVEPPGLETLLQTYFAGQQSPRQELRLRPVRRNWLDVKCFSCGKTGHSATRCPTLDVTFPFILPGWKAEKTSTGYLMISPKMATDRRRAENAD